MKKILVLLIVLCLSVSLYAGGNKETAPAQGKLVITMAADEFLQFGGDPLGDFIENKFNVDIVPILQEGDINTYLRLWAAADNLPDTFTGYPATQSWFSEFVGQELIRTIPYSMISKYPNLKKMVDNHSLTQEMKTFLGDYYYLPRAYSMTNMVIGSPNGIYYRKDWAEKLGYRERPKDMETFYNMLKDFTLKDPDGNRLNDTYGYIGSLTPLYAPFGAFPSQWVKGPNNQYIPGWSDEAPMLEALTWLRRIFSEGILDPEFTSLYTAVSSNFAQNVFGAMARNIDTFWVNRHVIEEFGGAHPGIDPLKTVDMIGSLSAKPGGTRYAAPRFDSAGLVFSVDCSDAKLDRLLQLYDWLISDEGNIFRYWGFKDTDYRVNADGSFTKLVVGDPLLRLKYPSIIIQNWPTFDFDYGLFDNPDYSQNTKNAVREYYQQANEGAANAYNKVNALASTIITEERSLFTFNSNLVPIISGSGDVAVMYREFIANANRSGLQNVIKSVNDALKK